MNSEDMIDLYADISASLAALTSALQAKGLLSEAELQHSAQALLADLQRDNPHPYLLLRELAGKTG